MPLVSGGVSRALTCGTDDETRRHLARLAANRRKPLRLDGSTGSVDRSPMVCVGRVRYLTALIPRGIISAYGWRIGRERMHALWAWKRARRRFPLWSAQISLILEYVCG